MAETALALTSFSRATANGHDLTAAGTNADNANGMSFANDGHTLLRVKNTSASAVTVTANLADTVDGQTVPGKTFSVPATTGDRLIGPFPAPLYGSTVKVAFSAGGASVSVWALRPTT